MRRDVRRPACRLCRVFTCTRSPERVVGVHSGQNTRRWKTADGNSSAKVSRPELDICKLGTRLGTQRNLGAAIRTKSPLDDA
eukprot:SAG11_NODE_9145_length_938_cov_1.785459_2_plen_81_part_01